MGSGGSAKPSFSFNDQQALQLQQANQQKLQEYQLQRQGLMAGQNGAMANYFQNTNSLAQNQMLQNMGYYTNALGGYQNSLNQNTADANSLLQKQNDYYMSLLGGQQQYQNSFANLMGQTDQAAAAANQQYQQDFLAKQGQYNQDNTAQQQQFMQNYLGQMADYNQQNLQNQQNYQQQYAGTQGVFSGLKQQAAAQNAQLNQQQQNQSLMQFLEQWKPPIKGYNPALAGGSAYGLFAMAQPGVVAAQQRPQRQPTRVPNSRY